MIGTTFPRLIIENSLSTNYPSSFRCLMGVKDVALSTGFDRKISVRAAGEAVERLLSFSGDIEGITYVSSDIRYDVNEWLSRITLENANSKCNSDILFIEVTDISTGEICWAPEVAFTLTTHPNDNVMPVRDSSGCALHKIRGLALDSAIAEYVERQSLSLFWYFGHCISAWKAEQIVNFLRPEIVRMVNSLIETGQLFVFDISTLKPYRAFIAVFVSRDQTVKFASGASSNLDFAVALNKAVLELYQAFTLMQQLELNKDIPGQSKEDIEEISAGYLGFNSTDTADIFTELFHHFSGNLAPCSIDILWRSSLDSLKVLASEKCLRFGPPYPDLHFFSVVSLNGFPVMSRPERYAEAFAFSGKFFGYPNQIRQGDIPFG